MSGKVITAEECLERSTRILDSTSRIELALFGQDGRGGISHDLSTVVMRLERIEDAIKKNHIAGEEQEGLDVKRFGIVVTAVSTIIATLITAVVTIWMRGR